MKISGFYKGSNLREYNVVYLIFLNLLILFQLFVAYKSPV